MSNKPDQCTYSFNGFWILLLIVSAALHVLNGQRIGDQRIRLDRLEQRLEEQLKTPLRTCPAEAFALTPCLAVR